MAIGEISLELWSKQSFLCSQVFYRSEINILAGFPQKVCCRHQYLRQCRPLKSVFSRSNRASHPLIIRMRTLIIITLIVDLILIQQSEFPSCRMLRFLYWSHIVWRFFSLCNVYRASDNVVWPEGHLIPSHLNQHPLFSSRSTVHQQKKYTCSPLTLPPSPPSPPFPALPGAPANRQAYSVPHPPTSAAILQQIEHLLN